MNVIRQLSADMGVPNVYRMVFMIGSDAAPELLLGKKMIAKDAGKIFIVGGDALNIVLHECEVLLCRGAELVPMPTCPHTHTHMPACPPTYLPAYLRTCPPTHLPTCLPACLPTCTPTPVPVRTPHVPPPGHTPSRYSYSPSQHLACASDFVEHSGSYLLAMLHGLCRVHFLLDLDGMKLAFPKADFYVDPDAEGADASATRGGATPLPAPGLTVPAGGQAATDGAPATNPRNPGAAAAAATAARSPTTAQISSMTDVEFGKFYHVICGYVIEPAAGMPAPPPSTTPDQWVKKMMLPEHLQRAQEVAAAFTAQPDLFITDRKKLFGQSALDAVAQSSATQTSVHPTPCP